LRRAVAVRKPQDVAGHFPVPKVAHLVLNVMVVALLVVAVALGLNSADRRTEITVAAVSGISGAMAMGWL